MERPARPSGAHSDETGPHQRDNDGGKDNRVRPVGMLDWVQRSCRIGSFGYPFVVETKGDDEGNGGCKVEDENGDVETGRVATPRGGNVDVRS